MKKVFLIIISSIFFMKVTDAQTKQETAVANAVEQLRNAMVNADSAMLDQLTMDELSYGHSGGHVDDKKEFVQKLASGKSDFVSINFSEQTITVSGKTAVVRHKLNAFTNDNGKPGEVHLLVLLVWQKTDGKWKLLARQAVKNQ
jgi:ketosteroid isomerase-like protein